MEYYIIVYVYDCRKWGKKGTKMGFGIWFSIVLSVLTISAVILTHRTAKVRGFTIDADCGDKRCKVDHTMLISSGRIAWTLVGFSGIILVGAVLNGSFGAAISDFFDLILVLVAIYVAVMASWLIWEFLREDNAIQRRRLEQHSSSNGLPRFAMRS